MLQYTNTTYILAYNTCMLVYIIIYHVTYLHICQNIEPCSFLSSNIIIIFDSDINNIHLITYLQLTTKYF